MRGRLPLLALVALPLLLVAAGCGGSASSCGCGDTSPAQPLVPWFIAAGPGEGLQSLTVAITRVEVRGPSGWITGSQARTLVDLVGLGGGQQGAGALSLPAGTYDAVRLTLEGSASAKLGNGVTVPVSVPFVEIATPVSLSVGDLAATELAVILDPARGFQARAGTYAFLPVLQALDRKRSGSVSGRITEPGGGGVAGLVVTAQAFEAFGEPRVLRRALTRSDGSYTLDLLPYGKAQHVVTWASAGGRAFEPRATAAFTPSAGQAAVTADLVVPARADSASVSGTLTPGASTSQSDEVELTFGPVQAGSEATLFIVGMRIASIGASETYAFGPFPQGSTYQLRVRRRTFAPDGSASLVSRYGDDLGFLTGITNVVDFQF